jgi:Cu/Ag efflux protein CusF
MQAYSQDPIQTLDSAAKGITIQHAPLEPAHLPHHTTLRFAEV